MWPLHISSNLNDHCSNRCYNRNVLFLLLYEIWQTFWHQSWIWHGNSSMCKMLHFLEEKNTCCIRTPKKKVSTSVLFFLQPYLEEKKDVRSRWLGPSVICLYSSPSARTVTSILLRRSSNCNFCIRLIYLRVLKKSVQGRKNGFSVGKTFRQIIAYKLCVLFAS